MEILVLVLVICGIIASNLGSRKGIATSSFFLGLILGPLGILLVYISKGKTVTCPFCKKLIFQSLKVCPHCEKVITSIK